MEESAAQAELPRYRCHKVVWALKIAQVNPKLNGCLITPTDIRYAPFTVDIGYARKHQPCVGGYYVVYEDGYKSFSPASAFESGYALIEAGKG